MKKKQVLELLPRFKTMKSELNSKMKQLERLQKEVGRESAIVGELEGVELHGDYPILIVPVVNDPHGLVEVYAGCEGAMRYAYVSRTTPEGAKPSHWEVTAYTQGSNDGTPLISEISRAKALTAAKDYVATGKIARTPESSPSR